MIMTIYERPVNYYETDKMGIVNNANYLHYLEEARLYYLTANGFSFTELEKQGIYSPTSKIEISYKTPLAFGDTIQVETALVEVTAVRFIFSYRIYNKEKKTLAAVARSEHCFADKDGRLIILSRRDKDLAERISKLVEKEPAQ